MRVSTPAPAPTPARLRKELANGHIRDVVRIRTRSASSTSSSVQHGETNFFLSRFFGRRLVALLGVVGRQRRQARFWRVRLGVSLEPRPRRPPCFTLFAPPLDILRVRAEEDVEARALHFNAGEAASSILRVHRGDGVLGRVALSVVLMHTQRSQRCLRASRRRKLMLGLARPRSTNVTVRRLSCPRAAPALRCSSPWFWLF